MFAVRRLHNFSVESSLPQNVITVTNVLPRLIYRPHNITVKFSPSRGNYRGYRGITAFPITVSSSNTKPLWRIILRHNTRLTRSELIVHECVDPRVGLGWVGNESEILVFSGLIWITAWHGRFAQNTNRVCSVFVTLYRASTGKLVLWKLAVLCITLMEC